MSKEISTGDGIHVRAVRYGYNRPDGFMWKDIEKRYSKREKEWQIVKKFLNDAFDNFSMNTNRETPYILLEQLGNKNADESKYTLSYQAYIQYFEYEKLQQAKKDTKIALWVAISTLLITFTALVFSICFSIKQADTPMRIDSKQFQEILRAVKK